MRRGELFAISDCPVLSLYYSRHINCFNMLLGWEIKFIVIVIIYIMWLYLNWLLHNIVLTFYVTHAHRFSSIICWYITRKISEGYIYDTNPNAWCLLMNRNRCRGIHASTCTYTLVLHMNIYVSLLIDCIRRDLP